MTHATTDPEQLNDGTRTRPTLPPITARPRVPVKRATITHNGTPICTDAAIAALATHCVQHSTNGTNKDAEKETA